MYTVMKTETSKLVRIDVTNEGYVFRRLNGGIEFSVRSNRVAVTIEFRAMDVRCTANGKEVSILEFGIQVVATMAIAISRKSKKYSWLYK